MSEVALQTCKINDDCTPGRLKRDWCPKHYQRWKAHGDPLIEYKRVYATQPKGADHPRWVGDVVTYTAMHQRVERARGKASIHGCINGCLDAPRYDWSYDGLDPDELVEPDGKRRRYSLKLDHYQPRCSGCHAKLDHSGENNPNAKLDWERVEEVRALAYFGVKRSRLAKMYDVTPAHLGRVVRVEWWIPEKVEAA